MTENTESAAVSEGRRRDIPLAVISVGMAAVVWWPAFTLGAWGTLFFDTLLTLWVASTAAFVFVLVERRPVGARLGRAFLLLLPSVWLVFSFIDFNATDFVTFVVSAIALLIVLIASPLTVWVLARIMWPDFGENSTRRQRWLILGVVLGIGVAAFVLGLNQARFLTCEDFTISGNSEPPGCVHEDQSAETSAPSSSSAISRATVLRPSSAIVGLVSA
ncbi:hypothetical protein SAMN04487846_2166 [Microbacterium sp. cf046]|uniref:hypothetical protein n=1 Tax=Microbacterium sp. cf046 TaxID=1761803 RepID=UPI0008E79C8F|nr:hypothetical protein [Microbacterium sp. cf046]SFS06904.1 hypothetical protein SAMN04487846_2166 [Microbacterium sp. cf046]